MFRFFSVHVLNDIKYIVSVIYVFIIYVFVRLQHWQVYDKPYSDIDARQSLYWRHWISSQIGTKREYNSNIEHLVIVLIVEMQFSTLLSKEGVLSWMSSWRVVMHIPWHLNRIMQSGICFIWFATLVIASHKSTFWCTRLKYKNLALWGSVCKTFSFNCVQHYISVSICMFTTWCKYLTYLLTHHRSQDILLHLQAWVVVLPYLWNKLKQEMLQIKSYRRSDI